MSIKDTILKYALQNAIKFNGKASPGAVIGKVLAEDPMFRPKAQEIAKEANKLIKDINKLTVEEQKKNLQKLAPELLEKKKEKHEKKELPELPYAEKGKVVTRIPPEPSKYNHIGHALSFLLNFLYAKKYNGKCILRFEDTNPSKAEQKYVDAMKKDVLEYLGITVDKTVFVSDHLPKFYKLAEELIAKGKAYVCFCDRETIKKNRANARPCEHRFLSIDENMEAWGDMLNRKYEPGVCSLRLKISMETDNYAMRDPVIMRINLDTHYRQKNKYCVWPMYDFENAIEDNSCGITHILRDINFGQMRVALQDYIKDLFCFPKQAVIQYGRFNVTGAVTQGRIIREMIEKKEVNGWDDPRLVTLRALKRRGFVKETFYELVLEVGLSPTPTNIDWTVLSSINRKILDPKAYRYFFIPNPKAIKIEGAPKQHLELDLHPDNKEGGRKFKTHDEFYVSPDDYNKFEENKLYRLMDCLNFKKAKNKLVFDSKEHEKFKDKGELILHWLPKEKNLVNVEVVMPDANVVKGLAEKNVKSAKVNEVVQFTRFGFCKLDKKQKNKLVFWFSHK